MKDHKSKDFAVGFIGGGHICEAITRGIIISGYVDPGMISISTLEEERRKELHKQLGVVTNLSNIDLAKTVDILFLSVRPLEILSVCEEISKSLQNTTTVITVAAGIKTDEIKATLGGHKNLIRIMPNLPARVGSSTTVIYKTKDCDEQHYNRAKEFMNGFGEIIEIEKEALIDPVTVLSGSAPAYYMMIADALIDYGVSEGIPKDICTRLVLDTMEGAAQWGMHGQEAPKDLWPKVVTKGGITATGMEVYNKKGLINIFIEGLKAATEKARAISK
ncbi:MAG: pyrroline-5-carboxylate reductase [bacterium]